MKITVIIPSRGRPDALVATVNSLLVTSLSPELVDIIVRLDEDDNKIPRLPDSVKVKIGPPISALSQVYNECCPSEGLVMLGADDILFETQNWDEIVRRSYSGLKPYGVVYGDDCSPASRLFGTHPIISIDWIKKVGFLAPENVCRHIDSFWSWVGKYLKRYERIEIVTRHTRHLDGTNLWMQDRVDSDLGKARSVFESIKNKLIG